MEGARVAERAKKLRVWKRDAKHIGHDSKKDKDVPAENKAEFEAAKEEMVALMTQLQAAKVRYFEAVNNMLQVPSMDGKELTSLVEKKEKDVLVVFYAPWCPHCQHFVLGDKQGNPEKAPLELLNAELDKEHKDTLELVRFDIDKNRAPLPQDFAVQYIPTIYLASADGKKTPFKGNPQDTAAIKEFIGKNAKNTKM